MDGASVTSTDLAGERRRITALFADVVGSTSMAESMDPEDWAAIMHTVYESMAAAVERYEGTVTQFGGDAIVAVFGAPRAHEDDPWRAVQAALDMIAEIEGVSRRLGTDIQLRVGVNTGLAIAGAVGSGSHAEYTAVGDTMNVAARLQSAASVGSVVISADTYRSVGPDVDVRDMGLIDVKGKAAPVHAYEVLGSRRSPTRARGIPGLHSPMVGRAAELELLESLVDIATAGRGRIAVLVGEPGIGKSRLLRELSAGISDRDEAGWALGRCVSFGQHMPYHLATSLVGALLGADDIDEPDSVIGAVRERGSSLDLDETTMDDLAELVGSVADGTVGDSARQTAYRLALASLIRARAARNRPLVLICEDVHWSDPSSAELLSELVPGCHDQPVLLILTSRPERSTPGWNVVEAARSSLGDALTEIRLEPLGADDARVLVAHLLEIEDLPESLRSLVLDKAEGNPFFVEEVVRMLIEREAIERREGHWIANETITSLEVPDTIEALIASRVDRLPDPARHTARLASVIGRRFPASLVEELDPADEGESFHPQLGVLEAHGLIRLSATRPEIEYAFRHALVQEVVYSSLLKRERRRLHAQVAEALERRHAEHADDIAPVLAHHFEEADDPRALHYLIVAGRRAAARYANREAFEHFDRARRRIPGDDEDSVLLRLECTLSQNDAGLTFIPTGVHLELLESALADAESLGDATWLLRVHLSLVRILNEAGHAYDDSEQLRHSMDEALRLAQLVEDTELRALPKVLMGDIRMAQAEFEEAYNLWSEAVPELERTGNLVDASLYAGMASRALAYLGRFGEAETWVERCRALAEESGDPNAILDADLFAGWLEGDRGNLEAADEFTRRAIEAADEVGNIACSLMGNMLAGSQQLRMGNHETAVSFLSRGNQLAEYCEIGRDTIALAEAWLAEARTRLGQPSLAELDAALDSTRAVKNPLNEGQILRQRATVRLLLDEVDWDAAIADFEAAEAIFDKIGARPFLAESLRDHGAALDLAGRTQEAEPLLLRAAELFDEMGLSPS